MPTGKELYIAELKSEGRTELSLQSVHLLLKNLFCDLSSALRLQCSYVHFSTLWCGCNHHPEGEAKGDRHFSRQTFGCKPDGEPAGFWLWWSATGFVLYCGQATEVCSFTAVVWWWPLATLSVAAKPEQKMPWSPKGYCKTQRYAACLHVPCGQSAADCQLFARCGTRVSHVTSSI